MAFSFERESGCENVDVESEVRVLCAGNCVCVVFYFVLFVMKGH